MFNVNFLQILLIMQTIKEASRKTDNMNNQPRKRKRQHTDRRNDKLQHIGG